MNMSAVKIAALSQAKLILINKRLLGQWSLPSARDSFQLPFHSTLLSKDKLPYWTKKHGEGERKQETENTLGNCWVISCLRCYRISPALSCDRWGNGKKPGCICIIQWHGRKSIVRMGIRSVWNWSITHGPFVRNVHVVITHLYPASAAGKAGAVFHPEQLSVSIKCKMESLD